MKYRTKEELEADIQLYEKAGAKNKVALLKRRLAGIPDAPFEYRFRKDYDPSKEYDLPPAVDARKDTQDKSTAQPIEETRTEASGGGSISPIKRIEEKHEEDMAAKKDEMADGLSKMKDEGLSWKEIRETTGVKAPQVLVAAWKRRQQSK